MTSSLSVVRQGSQVPRLESYPLYSTSAGDDAIDLAAIAGLVLDPWQEHILRHSLGEKLNGKWSAFRVALVVPRQNGKNALLEARELAGLFLFGEKRIIHTAHEVKTARESMDLLMNRLKATPELMEHVDGFDGDLDKSFSGMKTGNDPSIKLKNGNKLSYAARSRGSGRGFTGDLIVMDEAYALRADEMAAMVPTMAAKSMVGNPQLWFTSSAGMPESDLLNSMRNEGITRSSNRLAYFEWSAEDDADVNDVDAWYEANPGLGIRISEQYVMDELETMIVDGDEEQFKRERLGIWAKLGGDSVIPASAWSGCADEDSKPGDQLVFGVDISPSRASASISLVSYREDGKVHAEVVENREGTSWVGSRLAELKARWNPAAMVTVAGSAAESLTDSWKRDGAKVKAVRFMDYKQSCGRFFDMVTGDELRHVDDPVLNAAIEGAKQQWTADRASWYWSRKNSGSDITPLVALTVGLQGLEKRKASGTGERKAVFL